MFDGCFCFGFGRLLLTVEWIRGLVVLWLIMLLFGSFDMVCCGVWIAMVFALGGCCVLFVLLGVTA